MEDRTIGERWILKEIRFTYIGFRRLNSKIVISIETLGVINIFCLKHLSIGDKY